MPARREGTVGASPRRREVKSPVNTPRDPIFRGSAVRVRSVTFSRSACGGVLSIRAKSGGTAFSRPDGRARFLFVKIVFADHSASRRKNEGLQRASENLRSVGV